MTETDVFALLPLLILAGTAIAVMMILCVVRRHEVTVAVTCLGLLAALGSLYGAVDVVPRQVTPLLFLDGFSLFYLGLVIAASLVTVVLCYGYFRKAQGHQDELYILMLVATLGSAVLITSSHFASLILGLELLSVALYALIAYPRERTLPLEAALKYLVLAAVAAAFLLFGAALIYGALGTMHFESIARAIRHRDLDRWLVYPGLGLLMVGFGFKLALVPFHLWTPDVYQGAPAPVTAYIATVSKGAMLALMLRLFDWSGARELEPVLIVFSAIGVLTMLFGNLLALLQNSLKRLLAYSSIAHLGYMLVAFVAGGAFGPTAITFYLASYFVTTLGAFSVLIALSNPAREADDLADYRGLFWRRPGLAVVLTLMLLSLAGIPLTAGFMGKLYVVLAGVSAAIWAPVFTLVVASTVGLYYYLRVVMTIFSQAHPAPEPSPRVAPLLGVVLAFLTVALLWLGIFPQPFLNVITAALEGAL